MNDEGRPKAADAQGAPDSSSVQDGTTGRAARKRSPELARTSRALAASGSEDGDGKAAAKPTQATKLVRLAEERFRFGRTPEGDLFAVAKSGPPLVRMLRGGGTSLRATLADSFARDHGAAPSSSALASALLVLEGRALQAAAEPLALRVAERPGEIVLDLGDETGRAVVIRPSGWQVVSPPPVLFRRTTLTVPLPVPEEGGNLDELLELVHIAGDAWPLAIGWLLIAYMPSVPAPILFFRGAQGAGKSSAARLLSRLVDPSAAQLRSAPRDPTDWTTTASGSRVVPLDNLSRIVEWLGDALCRAVTGDGLARRALYTDSETVVFTFKRAIVLTAIAVEGVRGDLADRLLPIELDRIDEQARRTEAELEEHFARAHPRLLGALLDLLAQVLAVLPQTRPERLPRLADAGRVFAALDSVLGTPSFKSFCGIAGRLAHEVVEDDPVASALVELLDRRPGGSWDGSTAELLHALSSDKPAKGWPETVQALSGRLTRAEEALRLVGVTIERTRTKRGRLLAISKTQDRASDASTASPTSPPARLSEKTGAVRGDDPGDELRPKGDEGREHVTPTSPPHVTPQTRTESGIPAKGDEGDDVITSPPFKGKTGSPPWIAASEAVGSEDGAA